jgi:hypothetical protein
VQLTITCQDDELFLAIDSVRDDLGVGGDDLGFGFQRKVLLELEIPQRTGESEVTVDAAELDESARRGDTRSLLWAASVQTLKYKKRDNVPGLCPPLFVGLWSLDMAFASPWYPRTARESPELAWDSQRGTRPRCGLYVRQSGDRQSSASRQRLYSQMGR